MLFLYLALYVMCLLGVSWYVSRADSSEGFLIADRNRKWWTIALSKFAGAIGVGYFVAYTGYAYEYGFGVYLILIGTLFGYMLFGLWAAPRLYAHSREKRFYTQGDFVEHATGSSTARQVANWCASAVAFSWLMVGIVGGAKIISHFGLMSYELALVLTVGIVLSYIFIAGFRAVLATDVLQSFIIVTLIALLVWVIVEGVGVQTVLATQAGTLDAGTALGFLLFGLFAIFSSSSFYQLVYAARSARTAQLGITVAIVPIVGIATLLLMVGLFMFAQNPNLDSGVVFLEALAGFLPAALIPVGIVLFFAGLMSSADTSIYSIASHTVLSRSVSRLHPVRDIRIATLVLGAVAVAIGFFFRDVVDVTLFAAATSIVLSPGMLYLIAGGASAYRFLGSVVVSVVGLVVGISVFGLEPVFILLILAAGIVGLAYNGFLLRAHV